MGNILAVYTLQAKCFHVPIEKYWLNSEYQAKINRKKKGDFWLFDDHTPYVWRLNHSCWFGTDTSPSSRLFPRKLTFQWLYWHKAKTKELKQPGNCSLLWALQIKPKIQQRSKVEFSELWMTFKETKSATTSGKRSCESKAGEKIFFFAGSGSTWNYFRPLRFFCWSREE